MPGFADITAKLAKRSQAQMARDKSTSAETPIRLELSALPVRDETKHDRGRNVFFSRGQFLARQDRWDVLGRLIAETDRNRLTTPSGVSMASLLADGARADAVSQARTAIADGGQSTPAGITALEELIEDHAETWGVALVVARAQIECAWAWQGQVDPYALPHKPKPDFHDCFARAFELIDYAGDRAPKSAEIAASRCDLLAADPMAEARVDLFHARAMEADPENPGRLRAYGVHLLPRWFGTHTRLAATAEDMAVNDACDWGNRAYTWMWFDALRLDPGSAAVMEADRFIAGMHEILEINPAPHMANLMAAYAAGMSAATAPDDLSAEARKVRARIHAALPELLDAYLTELHPQVWARAHALPGSAHVGPLSHGRIAAAAAQARQAIDNAMSDRDEA